jgi:hypothetical protein
MQKIFARIGILAMMLFLTFPIAGSAGPLDQLKNLKIDSKTIMRPATHAVDFQFSNFQINDNTGNESAVWNVDVKISQSIPANLYVVKTLYQNRRGETLLAGEDLVLPAGNQGKTFHLTRPFQKNPGLSRITFQVYNQAEGRAAASQTYPLPAYGFLDKGRETVSAKSAVPQRMPDSSSAKPDMNFDVNFDVDRDTQQIHIQNKNSFTVAINEIAGKARFLAGVDQEITVDCKNKKTIQPGESITCNYLNAQLSFCPALTHVDLEAKISGNIYQKTLNYDAPIKKITKEPLVSMEKLRKLPRFDVDTSGATAKIIIRGLHVRIGSLVTIKALASLDSDRFPVVFRGVQEDDGIHAEISITGKDTNKKPDRFCFNIMEITTYDDLGCGGVGVLLYRNEYVWPYNQDVNRFLDEKECK